MLSTQPPDIEHGIMESWTQPFIWLLKGQSHTHTYTYKYWLVRGHLHWVRMDTYLRDQQTKFTLRTLLAKQTRKALILRKVRSTDIRRELSGKPLLLQIERPQLRWFGHLIRMPPGGICNKFPMNHGYCIVLYFLRHLPFHSPCLLPAPPSFLPPRSH